MSIEQQLQKITHQICAEAVRRNLTLGQLKIKWGVTESYVSVIMRGQRIPNIKTLDRIAAAMGIEATIKIGK